MHDGKEELSENCSVDRKVSCEILYYLVLLELRSVDLFISFYLVLSFVDTYVQAIIRRGY